MSENKKVCCNCEYNLRIKTADGIITRCGLDGHYIGYVDCMTYRCKKWKKTTKWKKED